MRVRFPIENGGHALAKHADLDDAPAAGSLVPADRQRRIAAAERDAECSEVTVYLAEEIDDLAVYAQPVTHLTFMDRKKAAGWDIKHEQALPVWVRDRIFRQGRARSVGWATSATTRAFGIRSQWLRLGPLRGLRRLQAGRASHVSTFTRLRRRK